MQNPVKYNPEDHDSSALSKGGGDTARPSTKPGDAGGSGVLTPAQARQVAFIHDITSSRCSCGDVDNCGDCSTTAQMKYLAGRHLGYF